MSQEISPKNPVKSVRNGHDKTFRNAMRNLVVARDMLSHHLPVEIQKHIDLSTLQIEDGIFIDPQLQESCSDILYSVEWQEKKSENDPRVFIYVLIEQQKNPEHLMPFRMIKYTCKIIDKHLANHETKVLPIVIPTVIVNYPKIQPVFRLGHYYPPLPSVKRPKL